MILKERMNEISTELIKSILCDLTISGKNRLERILENNSKLRSHLIFADTLEEQAQILIDWNNKQLKKIGIDAIRLAKKDIQRYSDIITEYSNNLDSIIDNLDTLKSFNYKHFAKVLTSVTDKSSSKLIRRINNAKLLFVYSSEMAAKCNNDYSKVKIKESLIHEITYQKGFMWSLLNNIEMLPDEYFMLGLLLFDIPGDPDSEHLEINRRLNSIF